MTISAIELKNAMATLVTTSDDGISVDLSDGRSITVPIA